MCFAMSYFFLAFPKNAQKNNAREVAKISLAFSLAFILQSRYSKPRGCGAAVPGFSAFCAARKILQKGTGIFAGFEYNREEIVQI